MLNFNNLSKLENHTLPDIENAYKTLDQQVKKLIETLG